MIVHKVVLRAVIPMLRRLPYRVAYWLLGVLGRLDLIVVPNQARLYESAVASGAVRLGRAWDVRAVSRALARQTYRWRARDLLLDGRSDAWVARLFQVEGRDRLDAALAGGRGVIILASHFGSHVALAHWLFRWGYPPLWFGEKPRNVSRFLARHLEDDGPSGQSSFLSRAGTMAESASAVLRAARRLRAGRIVALACDVRWRDAKVATATFLGRTETVSASWVHLAATTGAAVVPAFCWADETGTFHLEFREPFSVPTDARRDGAADPWVQEALTAVEDQVRRFPEQSNDYFFW